MSHHSDARSPSQTQHGPANIALDPNPSPFHSYDVSPSASDFVAFGPTSHATESKRIRAHRRITRACDQCRKCKIKCERAADDEPCRSCSLLGTTCTYLGPPRKRSLPRGYIDTVEARLNQAEALLGILLAVEAERVERLVNTGLHGRRDMEIPEKSDSLEGLLTILRKDTLAREILNRVDASPYGVKGRKNGSVKARPHVPTQEDLGSGIGLHSTYSLNEWQDRVATLLSSSLQSQNPSHLFDGHHMQRQRRRIDSDDGRGSMGSPVSWNGSASPGCSPVSNTGYASGSGYVSGYMGAGADSDGEDDVVDAVGQLSVNEDEQLRYHGKASGLYLLGFSAKEEARNEGGIWRFPKTRAWPRPPSHVADAPKSPFTAFGPSFDNLLVKIPGNASAGHLTLESDLEPMLPDPTMQEHLLQLYFIYVHSAFPILHKDAFWEGYRSMQNPQMDVSSLSSDQVETRTSNSSEPLQKKRSHVSHLLLFCMFAIAARYSPSSSPPPSPCSSTPTSPHPLEPTPMWTAGDDFLLLAKNLLDNTYTSSLPSTVQSLLLLGYREIGFGAMAQAWTYTGMAVRMAQDLGMHRAADGWARVGMGRLFNVRQLQERKRIWWGCVVLDGYVSTDIGRPLAIFERDYDTQLPSIEENDEQEMWAPHPSLPPDTRGHGYRPDAEITSPVPGHIVSCFTASATLSTILSKIVQSIYSIRNNASRHAESTHLEGWLDKWYLDLPEHLRFGVRYDATGNLVMMDGRIPPPHILTLHMQYWCTTLLLHRPFIRMIYLFNKNQSENEDNEEVRVASQQKYGLCVGAANHITSIVAYYREKYSLQRAPVFLCFYVFTAGIMHVTSLSVFPNDPQARLGLTKCLDALRDMEAVWPSASRAHELLHGCGPPDKNTSKQDSFGQLSTRQSGQGRLKRAAEHAADSENVHERSQMQVPSSSGGSPVPSPAYSQPWHSAQFQDDFSAMSSLSMAQSSNYHWPSDRGSYIPSPSTSTDDPMTQSSSYYPLSLPADGGSYAPFPGTLSTSVLPQMYSTGLIDERRLPHMLAPSQLGQAWLSGDSTVGAGSHVGYETTSGGQYPQYWNDYTTFPQMGMAYGQTLGDTTQGQERNT